VAYCVNARGWSLWWPCRTCGGAELPLRSRPGETGSSLDAAVVLREAGAAPCPRCQSAAKGREGAGTDPAVWYDTARNDWVVRLPRDGRRAGTVLPLHIGWFDAPWAEVYRAASDVVHGAENRQL